MKVFPENRKKIKNNEKKSLSVENNSTIFITSKRKTDGLKMIHTLFIASASAFHAIVCLSLVLEGEFLSAAAAAVLVGLFVEDL